MQHEKIAIIVQRLIYFVLLIISLLLTIFLKPIHPQLEIIDENVTIDDESIGTMTCSVSVTFNQEVESGYITLAFYDENGKQLETTREYFSGYGETVTSSYIIVNGKADSYEILSFEMNLPSDDLFLTLKLCIGIVVCAVFFALFISSLFFNCKQFELDNRKIVVYAGAYRHYLKIDGEVFDEHNTLTTHVPIVLSTVYNGHLIQATISLTYRIALKIDNKLVRRKK